MIIDKSNYNKCIVQAINNELEDYGEWCLNTTDNEHVLQVVLYDYHKNVGALELQDMLEDIRDAIDKYIENFYIISDAYVECTTGNIIFEFIHSIEDCSITLNCPYSHFEYLSIKCN